MFHRHRPAFTLLIAIAFAACTTDAARSGDAASTDSAAGVSADSPAMVSGPSTPAVPATADGAMLDPNTATRDQLLQVPGMTAAAADALIAGRPYADMRAANTALASLGESIRDSVYTRVWKPLDLNSATAEEITLIPGVGDRMRHEFEEYRPYTSMAQFRREIGKYVDEAEVARLEQYVTIR
jgi:DNA uptake protein ComE-like DNA-binding protein